MDPEAATSAAIAICTEDGQAPAKASLGLGLTGALFSDRVVNRWRLQSVMARWCAVGTGGKTVVNDQTRGYNVAIADQLESRISSWCTLRILDWLGERCASQPQSPTGAWWTVRYKLTA